MKIIAWLYCKQENAKNIKYYEFWNKLYRWYYWSIFNRDK